MTRGASLGLGRCARPAQWHFLQSDFWARHKTQFGWTAVRLGGGVESRLSGLLTLSRRLPGGVLLTYVPYAPASRSEIVAPGVPGPGPAELAPRAAAIPDLVTQAVTARIGGAPTLIRFDLPQKQTWVRPSRAIRPGPAAVQIS